MNVTKNHRATGSIYEEKIAAFLKQNGFLILERNYRCKQGEIDIIARDGRYLVFIEVKFRATGSTGFSLEAIDRSQKSVEDPECGAVLSVFSSAFRRDTVSV